ncbi:hypothetical protein EJB05_43730 [Eragrostis curvula]|uniref:HTH La-type RNA-binding domain-containing protein n=1 Tax=Eragrostis curvula TaxID=38414 RepID=A0A5J9TG77_9POAL|nr:hypothetical protein EJB05_43730 [Eragrostis curvula]
MSPAAGGAAPAQSAAAAAAVVAPAIAVQEPDRVPGRRDPPGPAEGADPANAAARKTAWGVPAPSPAGAAAAASASPAGGIIGGDALWPALVESKRGEAKSASSDSLKSPSDGSGPSAQEDSIAASVPPHPVVDVKPISTGSSPTSMLPPNVAATASSQQNGSTTQPNQVRRSGSNGGNTGGGGRGNGGSGGRRAANNNGGGGSSGSGGDGHRNGGSLGSGCNSSNGDASSGTSTNGDDRNSLSNNNGNNNIRGVVGRSSNGDVGNRNSAGGSNHWNNRNNGASNGGGGRGGYRGRRDHERGGNFSPRNYPRVMPYHQHQQQPGVYQQQPGPFPRPPPPPATHFMVPQHFMPYVPTFPYHGDVQSYPFYLPPVEQFQNMHLVRPPVQPSWVSQEQPNLHEDIRTQIEFYFSTNNLCHDTFLRRQMNDQGWVSIELILSFNRMRAFTGLVDTNYILDAIRGSELLEVQGNNVRRRNDWAEWLLH